MIFAPIRVMRGMVIVFCVGSVFLAASLHAETPAIIVANDLKKHVHEGEPLKPEEVAVVANSNFGGSVGLAHYYMKARAIPEKQLLVTAMTPQESVSRIDYERSIAPQIRDFLVGEKLDKVRCVVLIYGVPLKIEEPPQSPELRKLEVLARSTLDQQLGQLIDQVKSVQKLARGADEKISPLPDLNPSENMDAQLSELNKTLIIELRGAVERIKKLSSEDEKKTAYARWLELVQASVGAARTQNFGAEGITWSDAQMENFNKLKNEMKELRLKEVSLSTTSRMLDLSQQLMGSLGTVAICRQILPKTKPDWTWRAALDSELCTLFWPQISPAGYVSNPLAVTPGSRGNELLTHPKTFERLLENPLFAVFTLDQYGAIGNSTPKDFHLQDFGAPDS